MKITLRTLQPIVILALALGLIAVAFRQAPEAPKVLDEENFIPRTEAVRYMALGHNSTAASLLWINGLISYGEGIMTGKSFRWITHLADASTRLDSLFKTPYTFVAAITPLDEKDTSDFPVLRRGIAKYPEDWQLAISLALRLAEGPVHDQSQASKIMQPFSNDTTVPPYVRSLHQSFYLNAQTTDIALTAIISDCLNPQYKGFRSSLVAKAARAVGIKARWPATKPVYEIIIPLMNGQLTPETAFQRLRALKKIP